MVSSAARILALALSATSPASSPAWPFPAAAPAASPMAPEVVESDAPAHAVAEVGAREPAWPVRGQLDAKNHFEPESVHDVAVDGPFVMVAANSGLWVHDAENLVRRGRLFAGPVGHVAVSRDLESLAFTAIAAKGPADLWVISLPSLEARWHVKAEEVRRLRFSDSGDQLFIAAGDDVLVLPLATGQAARMPVGSAVNDVCAVPGRSDLVTAAHNGDSVDILTIPSAMPVIRTEAMIRERGLEVFTRDQQACTFLTKGPVLFGGGDDNMVWRVTDPLGNKPRISRAAELDGNVVALGITGDGLLIAADDRPEVVAMTPDGKRVATLHTNGRSVEKFEYRPVVLAAGPSEVFAAVDGTLVRWLPKTKKAWLSEDYLREGAEFESAALESGTLLLLAEGVGSDRAWLQRAPAKPGLQQGALLGPMPASPRLLRLAHDDVLVEGKHNGSPRLVLVPAGGTPQKPIELPFIPSDVQIRPDQEEVAFMSSRGQLATFDRATNKVTARGKLAGKGESVRWNATTNRWERYEAGD